MKAMHTTVLSPTRTEYQELLLELLPEQGRWTEEQYLCLTDHTRRRIEFTDGYLEPLPMPTDRHQTIMEFIFVLLLQYLAPIGGKAHVAGIRLQIRSGKYREPDLLALKDANDPRRQDRYWTGADLAMEIVSKDKPERDLVDKRHDYAEGGVPEYWIVNPQTETITVLKLDHGAYVEQGTHGRGTTAVAATLPGFSVGVDAVFDAR